MSSFIGRCVRIETADFSVEGTAAAIENGRLVLENVMSYSTGEYLPQMIIEGTSITNVELCEAKNTEAKMKKPAPAAAQAPVAALAKRTPESKQTETASKEPVSRANEPKTKGVAKIPASFTKEKSPRAQPPARKQNEKGPAEKTPGPETLKIPQNSKASTPQNPAVGTPANSKTTQSASPIPQNVSVGPCLYTSDQKSVPIATPLQLSQIIGQMKSLGFNSAGIAERAAEGLCQIMAIPQGAIVLLVGTHMVGHWAIAAGRRLALRGYNVVAVSPAADAAVQLADESKSFVAAGGHFVTTQKALFSIVGEKTPPEIVIDALGGFETPLVDQLDEIEYTAATWLVNWSNTATKRISLCLPLVSNTTVVGFGFPLGPSGYVVDIGVPQKALTALKLKRFQGFKWSSSVLSI